MDILYISDAVPEYVKGGVILFNLKDRVMSRIKNKVWKTLSHAGILYQSMVSGQPTTWVTYMDEIYGIISAPLHVFLRNESLVRGDENARGWAIRHIPNFDSITSRALNLAISKHSQEDSHLGIDEDNNIMGSFDDELKSILGIVDNENRGKEYNTNIGFVFDILKDFWTEMKISESDLPKPNKIGFSEDEIAEDDLIRSFAAMNTTEELLKSVNQLLSMVNLTTHTINPPIQPLITKTLPLFDNKLIVPSTDFYKNPRNNGSSNIYPRITEERQHVAAVISRMFESGLGAEGVREYFEEELETTTLARRGRTELTVEYARDLVISLRDQLLKTKDLLGSSTVKLSKLEREAYNGLLQNLVVAQGSLLAHLNIDDVRIDVDSIKL